MLDHIVCRLQETNSWPTYGIINKNGLVNTWEKTYFFHQADHWIVMTVNIKIQCTQYLSICIAFHIFSKHSGFGISMTVCKTTHTDTHYYMSFAWDLSIYVPIEIDQMISYQSYSSNRFQRLQISKLIPHCLDLPSVPDLHLQRVEQHPWYHPSPNICIYG